jgi:type IV secretion system protein VirB1
MGRVVQVESSGNPYAIGVVGGRLERQPRDLAEAVATARWLDKNGYNYSVGLAQVNRANFARFGMTINTAFDACWNLHAGGEILKECFKRAAGARHDEQGALRDAFSCYYAGNFETGYKQGYVLRVVNATARPAPTEGSAQYKGSGGGHQKKTTKREYRSLGNPPDEAGRDGDTSSQSALLY